MNYPKEASPRRPILTDEQYQALVRVATQVAPRMELALVLAHETGHRIGAIRLPALGAHCLLSTGAVRLYLSVWGAAPGSPLTELQLAGALMLFPGGVVFALATAFMMRDEYPTGRSTHG